MRDVRRIPCEGEMTAGQDLVVIGTIALKGAAELARWGEETLRKRFSASFVKRCQTLFLCHGVKGDLPDCPESGSQMREISLHALSPYGVTSLCAAGEGGILTALWDYFDAFSLGFAIELRKIPVLQETIEVCEVFDGNPYRLQSEGCFLVTAANGGALVQALQTQGISASVIGRTTKQIGRRIYNGEIETFLDKPTREELERIQSTGGKA